MRAVIPDPLPVEVEELLERRRERGADRHDEVWEGVLHMAPAPSHAHARIVFEIAMAIAAPAKAAGLEVTTEVNVGESEQDYRVPDLALHHPGAAEIWHPTVALAVEVLSPGEDISTKLGFYAAHHVSELLIVDGEQRTARWLALSEGAYGPVGRSRLVDLSAEQLTERIDWPA
jgi:Uma2 family endonuclease